LNILQFSHNQPIFYISHPTIQKSTVLTANQYSTVLTQPTNILHFSPNHSKVYSSHRQQYSTVLTQPFSGLQFSHNHSIFYSSHTTIQYSTVLTQPFIFLKFSQNHSIVYSSHTTIQYSTFLTKLDEIHHAAIRLY